MPDVRLPSGKVIKNVPEGTSKEELMRKLISSGAATEEDFGMPAPEPQPQPQPQAQPEPQPQPQPQAQPRPNVLPERANRPPIVAGEQNLFEELSYLPMEALRFGVGALDLAKTEGYNTAGRLAKAIYDLGAGINKAGGVYDEQSLDRTDQQILDSSTELANFLSVKPLTGEGEQLQETIAKNMSEAIEGTAVEDGLMYVGNKFNEMKKYLTELTGSEVYTNAIIGGGEAGLAVASAGYLSKGYRVTNQAALRDVREAAITLGDNVNDLSFINKMRDVRDVAYAELGEVPLKKGSFDRAIKAAADELDSAELSSIMPDLETGIKRQNKSNAIRKSRFGSNYTEKLEDVVDLQRQLRGKAAQIGGKEGYALNKAAAGLDKYLFDNANKDFGDYSWSTKTPEEAKKLRGNAQRVAGQVIRNNQIREAFQKAQYKVNENKTDGLRDELAEIMKDPNKRDFYNDREKQLFTDIIDGKPTKTDGRVEDPYVRMFGKAYSNNSNDGGLVFAAKMARAIDPLFRQIATVQPARFVEGLLTSRKQKYGKAYTNLSNQVLMGKSGQDVIERYLKAVPRKKRDMKELGELLAYSDVDLQALKVDELVSKIQKDALEYARGLKVIGAGLALSATNQRGLPDEDEDEEQGANTRPPMSWEQRDARMR